MPEPPADIPWYEADLIAIDLEGTGAQDRENEAILEIALVPIIAGHPRVDQAYETLLNPGHHVPQRTWISPGLTDDTLATAPELADIATEITRRINGHYLVGHNVGFDWRLLHRHLPETDPAGLIDTLRLARHLHPESKGRSLTELLEHLNITREVNQDVPTGRPHRALWDATAAAHLLAALLRSVKPCLPELIQAAAPRSRTPANDQPTLWD